MDASADETACSADVHILAADRPCTKFLGIVPYSSLADSGDDEYSNHFDDFTSRVSDSDSEDSVIIPVYHRIGMHLKGSRAYMFGSGSNDEVDSQSARQENELSNDDNEAEAVQAIVNPVRKRRAYMISSGSDDEVDSQSARQENEPSDNDNEDEAVETVELSLTTRGGRRKWDKRDFCIFCKKPQSKLIRHMMLKHRDEVEVEDFMDIPLKSKRRHLMQRKLRNDGNYMHNVSVLKDQSGKIIPFRRPSTSQHSSDD